MKRLRSDLEFQITLIILGFVIITTIYAFIIDDFQTIIEGFKNISISKSALITDYFSVGGIGATLLNGASTALFCLILYKISKAKFNGVTLAVTFTVAGFSFFGKNILNLWPIIFGAYIYTVIYKVKFKSIIHIAILSTSLAPVVSEAFFLIEAHFLINLLISISFGVLVGFITVQVALFTPQVHQGYQLYNVGFASGIVGMIFTALINFFGHQFETNSIVSSEYNLDAFIYIILLCIFFIIMSLLINPKGFLGLKTIIKQKNIFNNDYTSVTCISSVLLNMALLTLVYTLIVVAIKHPISGPIIGGLLTIAGFSSCGKNIFNTIFIAIGVILFSELGHLELNSINIMLALLFGTCLAPIVNKYGTLLGIIAGMLHVCLVMNVSILHSGLNLYNNGFAAGLLCLFLIPLFDGLHKRFPHSHFWLNIHYYSTNPGEK